MIITRPMRVAITTGVVTMTLTGLLTGCTSDSPAAAPTRSASPSGSPTPSTSAPSGSPTTTAPSNPTVNRCNDANLAVTYGPGPGQGPNGAIAAAIVFTNTSAQTCRLSGYPGVVSIDKTGKVLANSRRTLRGPLGGLPGGVTTPPVVELSPGQVAIADIEGGSQAANCTSAPASLRVAVPDTAVAHVLAGTWSACQVGVFVHPIMRQP